MARFWRGSVFLAVALSSEDGAYVLPSTLFAVIGWGDRRRDPRRATRQDSPWGTLMDPVTDRLRRPRVS